MTRKLSEERKRQIKAKSDHHWWRCRTLAPWLSISPSAVSRHWACCIGRAGVTDDDGSPQKNDVAESACRGSNDAISIIKESYLDCLLRRAEQERRLAAYQRSLYERHIRRREEDEARRPDTKPMDSQVKIMLWAIRTCGNDATAAEAFRRAMDLRKTAAAT